MNHWEIDINDEETFSEDFRNLSETSKEFVKDCIADIVKCKDLDDYEYIVDCKSIPTGIVFVRFPNKCEVILKAHFGTLFFLRTYDDIDDALKD